VDRDGAGPDPESPLAATTRLDDETLLERARAENGEPFDRL